MLLSDYLRAQANWRELKAKEYPEDERNAQSAAALNSLADYVNDDPEERDSWRLPILEEQMEVCATFGDVAQPGQNVSRFLSRYGFHYPAHTRWQHAECLAGLVPLALLDAYELACAGTPDGDRGDEHLAELADRYGLNPWEVEAALGGVTLGQDYFHRRSDWTEQEQRDAIDSEREWERELGRKLDPKTTTPSTWPGAADIPEK